MGSESKGKRLVVVLGASGAQGFPTVKHLLTTSNDYRVRAVSRDVTKKSMKDLEALGAELVEADYDDLETLHIALEGAHSLFAITDFAATFSVKREFEQGKMIVDAASAVPSLQHFIWSSMPDTLAMSQGRYRNIVHCHANVAVLNYAENLFPSLREIMTELEVVLYFDNWASFPFFFSPLKEGDEYIFTTPLAPDYPLPRSSPTDTGKVVLAILQNPGKTLGKTVRFTTQSLTLPDMLKQWAEVRSKRASYHQISKDDYEARGRKLYTPIVGEEKADILAKMIAEMMALHQDIVEGRGKVQEGFIDSSEIIPPGTSFLTWMEYVQEGNLPDI